MQLGPLQTIRVNFKMKILKLFQSEMSIKDMIHIGKEESLVFAEVETRIEQKK